MESHVKEEIARQLDYYVDAYRKVRDIDVKMAQLSERMSELSEERAEAVRLQESAQSALDSITGGIPEDDEPLVREMVDEHLKPLIGLMVL